MATNEMHLHVSRIQLKTATKIAEDLEFSEAGWKTFFLSVYERNTSVNFLKNGSKRKDSLCPKSYGFFRAYSCPKHCGQKSIETHYNLIICQEASLHG